MSFPIDLSLFTPLSFDLEQETLDEKSLKTLRDNVELYRDTIVFFTAIAGAKGLSGHTGGPYNIVPEVLIAESFMRGSPAIHPVCFDEAGHRVAIQYALAAINGEMPVEKLFHYREADYGLYGHPELDRSLGIKFSSGRLGHMWPFVNGVARANPQQAVFVFGSDGSQQEGNDAEAARHAVAHSLNVKVIVDDNDVTIAGHPSKYLPGFDVERTLTGHGVTALTGDGEDLPGVYRRVREALRTDGPVAVVNRRPMAPGVPQIEGKNAGHDVVPVDAAIEYLEQRGQKQAVDYLKSVSKLSSGGSYRGSSTNFGSNRKQFGATLGERIKEIPESERTNRILVIDSDLEGSTGLNAVGKEVPEVYVKGGVMERGNFSVAAGFGFEGNRQGVFSTFSAFLEMVVSEISMARLNESNVLCHFSHAGVDDLADNTCHYGINIFYGDSSPAEISERTRLYFPADVHQMTAVVRRVFEDPGIRFVFSTRSKTPEILDENGAPLYAAENGYVFEPDRDEVVREGSDGYVVSYGDILYRALDAVHALKESGIDVGLVNKPTLNVIDEESLRKLGESPAVLVAENQNRQNGLGVRLGAALAERGFAPAYSHVGITRQGRGGLGEHVFNQGLDSDSIAEAFRKLRQAGR